VEEVATGEKFALKMIDKAHIFKQNKAHQPTREKKILEALSHANIITLYCTFQDSNSLCMFLPPLLCSTK